jgi:hypothetical protein
MESDLKSNCAIKQPHRNWVRFILIIRATFLITVAAMGRCVVQGAAIAASLISSSSSDSASPRLGSGIGVRSSPSSEDGLLSLWTPWDIAAATGGSGGGGNCSAAALAAAASLLALEVGRVLDIILAMFQSD